MTRQEYLKLRRSQQGSTRKTKYKGQKKSHKKNVRVFEVKYIPPTNSRGAKMKIIDLKNNVSVTKSMDYGSRNLNDQAIKYLGKRRIFISAQGYNGKTHGSYLISNNHVDSIK